MRRPLTEVPQPSGARAAHRGRICGVELSVSGLVLSVAAHPEDQVLRVWKLGTHEPAGEVPLTGSSHLGGKPSCTLLRAQHALAAVAMDDGGIYVADLDGAGIVRTFNCGAPAVDMAFSSESRWLAVVLRGGALRVFDLPAARCIDAVSFARPAMSCCFVP